MSGPGSDHCAAVAPWTAPVTLRRTSSQANQCGFFSGERPARERLQWRGATRYRSELGKRRAGARRSEEHTSELQSLMRISYAVFCLKKKNNNNNKNTKIEPIRENTSKQTHYVTSTSNERLTNI